MLNTKQDILFLSFPLNMVFIKAEYLIFSHLSIDMVQISYARIRTATILLNLNYRSSTKCSLTIDLSIQLPSNMDFRPKVCSATGFVPTKPMDMLS